MMAEEHNSRLGRLYAGIPKNSVQAKDGTTYTHQVPARDEPRVLIEVDIFPINGLEIGGQHVKHGKSRVVVYESDLPAIQARVASNADVASWEAAQSVYQSALDAYVDGAVGKRTSPKWSTDPNGYAQARKIAESKFGDTTTALEYARTHRGNGRPPITSLELVEELPAPTTQDNREAQRFEGLITRLVDALGKAAAQPKAAKAG